ncbi:SPOR domain-containing protein [Psychromonas algicola]|uniref:SPOR domain-containing protein n=1 Tax=Psychromonas algicola TaxID=2555642 RepID=UPI001067B356|nr:SPOR domain-containing protein [Psychromonas sp. RZ5]TEW51551.1 SPOR domain-containing protein [Psychromonas sp. RZ5]
MASQFKNRLVGVTILVALVVIFLPSIIDGEKTSYQQEFVTTPIKPALKEHSKDFQIASTLQEKKIVIQDALQTNNTADLEVDGSEWKVEEISEVEDKDINQIAATETEKSEPVNQTAKTAFADPAWTIQLGAFQNKENINTLLKKLNKAGFQVHTIPKEVMEGQLTRVFVGPDVSKKALEEKLPRLKRLTNLNGKLVPFNPIEP